MLPLILKLKRTRHKEVARAQDIIIEELYNSFEKPVLHGGTAIWRCYSGNRFSEDIDAYLPKDVEKVSKFFSNLEKKGFLAEKKKISQNSIFSKLLFGRVMVRFEAVFKGVDGSLKEYETCEGNLITVYTLTAEALIKEKTAAYLGRLKIRDLYDIFFLLRHVKDKEKVAKDLKMLIKRFKNPEDEEELKVLIIEGVVPSTEKMVEYIRGWV